MYLFTDGSLNPKINIGFGAYFILDDIESVNHDEVKIHTKKFEDTSSTKLEVETLLWALKDTKLSNHKVTIYTDCQNILGLNGRRERLEKNDYFSKKGTKIKNHLLYKEFYLLTDTLQCEFIKIKGHKKSSLKDDVDKLFALVDRGARDALRSMI